MGVPEKWEVYRDQWRKFIKEQRQMLSGSAASLSSWSNASSFEQASGFLNSTKGDSILDHHIQTIESRRTHGHASSTVTSNTGHYPHGLRHGQDPLKYSWEYLAEGKQTNLSKSDGSSISPTKKGTKSLERMPYESTTNNKDSKVPKDYGPAEITSAEKSNHSPISTQGTRQNQKRKACTGTRLSSNKYNKSLGKIQDSAVFATNVPTSPKQVKDLFSVVKNNRRYRTSKVGKCIICSISYSIPYIERHIINKHPSLVLDLASNKLNSSPKSDYDHSRSAYLRPRIVITKLDGEEKPNKNHKFNIPISSRANEGTSKIFTASQTKINEKKDSSSKASQKNVKCRKIITDTSHSPKNRSKSSYSKTNKAAKTKEQRTCKSKYHRSKYKKPLTPNKTPTTNKANKKTLGGKKNDKSQTIRKHIIQASNNKNERNRQSKNISAKKKATGNKHYPKYFILHNFKILAKLLILFTLNNHSCLF